MRSLKAQIQPHCLFNSLNTIYGLVRKSPPKAAKAVLRLSDLLRYTIRQSGEDMVSLTDEIAYIDDYVEFQKMRSDYAEDILFEVTGDPEQVHVAPLLFIPFVENAFKYGDRDVDIRISVDSNWVRFECINKIALSGDGDNLESNVLVGNSSSGNRREGELDSTVEKREKFVLAKNGTGIENARKRLGLIYPDRHTLNVRQEGDSFKVNLELKR